MHQFLNPLGSLAGIVGTLVCLVAGFGRIFGSFHVGGYSANTLFIMGIGLMVFACLVKLEILLSRLNGSVER